MHVFALLGDPVRFRIVEILASGTHSAGALAEAVGPEFGISRTAVSHQLRTLREAGFVDVAPDENMRLYRLRWDALDQVDRILLDLYEKWDRRTGWPNNPDPLADPPRRHRLAERRHRHLSRWEVEPRMPPPSIWDEHWDGEEIDESEGRLT